MPTNIGAFGENFPYSNLHDMNQDWIIKIARDFLNQYTHLQEMIESGEVSLTEATEQGISSLEEKATELEALLNQWYNTHSSDIASQLATALSTITATQISVNQSIEQKGADTLATIPDNYTALSNKATCTKKNLLRYNSSNLFNMQDGFTFSGTYYGVTVAYDPVEDCFTLNGTSTSAGNINLYNDSAHLIEGLTTGEPYIFRLVRSNMNITGDLFAYVGGQWQSQIMMTANGTQGQAILPSNATGLLIRISIPNATTFTNEKVKVQIFKDFTAIYNGVVANIAIANNVIYDPSVIEYYLSHGNRICVIEAGTHTINRAIKMGYGSTLCGTNANTSIITPNDSDFDCIEITNVARVNIKDLHIQGLVVNIGSSPTGFGCGILVNGDDSANYPRHILIENCQIHGFQGGAIVLNNNSYWCAHSVTIDNCELWRNYAGIWTKPKAEYNRISNCLMYSNYIGILNDSGNNLISNCTLAENTVGFYIDANATINNGHGSITGCNVNHNGNDTGFAFILRNVPNGFIINGCNIWYGKVIVSDSSGIMFTNCLFGNADTPNIECDDNDSTFFMNCLFKTTPTIVGTTLPTLKNCYQYDGSVVE